MTKEQKKMRLIKLADDLRSYKETYQMHVEWYSSRYGLLGLKIIEKLDEINALIKELEI